MKTEYTLFSATNMKISSSVPHAFTQSLAELVFTGKQSDIQTILGLLCHSKQTVV